MTDKQNNISYSTRDMILIHLEQNSTAHELNEMQNSNADTNKAMQIKEKM
jgi:hypothetical protein